MARFPITAAEAYLPADLRGDDADNVRDNLAASATPVSVEPAVRKRRNMREEQIARLVSLGSTPEEAAMYVDRMIEVTGSDIDPELFDSYNTPENNESLRRSIAAGNASAARLKAFELDYNAATGHPEYGYDESGNPAKLGKVDIDKQSAVERAGRRAAAYQFDAPYNSELESENNPMSDERRAQIAADWDQAVARREAQWALAESQRDLQNKREVEKYGHGNEREITEQQAAARYERDVAEDKMRQDPAVVEARIKRMAKAAGISMSEARDLYESGMEENGGGQTFAEFRRGTQGLRDRATDRRLAEQKAARDNWRATAMLAGGSQNLNSGNRWIANSLVRMNPEDRETAMRYMLPGGQLHAHVDAANAEAAADMAQRAMTAFLANNPGASELQREGLRGKRRLEAQDWFDSWLYKNHGTRGQGGLTVGPYTAASMENAVNYMMQVYDLSRPEAEAIAQSQGVPGVSQSPAEAAAGGGDGGPGGFGGAPAGGPGGF